MHRHAIKLGVALGALLIGGVIAAPSVSASDIFFSVTVDELSLDPPFTRTNLPNALAPMTRLEARAYIEVDRGEAYLLIPERFTRGDTDIPHAIFRVEGEEPINGTLVAWLADSGRVMRFSFRVDPVPGDAEDEAAFHRAKAAHYENLLRRDIPGAAWFRYLADAARDAAGEPPSDTTRQGVQRTRPQTIRERGELLDTYEVFTGGRALSENLQLDRLLPETAPGAETIDVASIQGITIAEFDWDSLTAGLDPTLDPLADAIPIDQHAIFFPDFDAFVSVLDEMELQAFPLFQVSSPRGEAFRTLERYETQLAVTVDDLARQLGGLSVRSVAVTGSDPYLLAGTDVAFLFETPEPEALKAYVTSQHEAAMAAGTGVRNVAGAVNGVGYLGIASPDRQVSSLVAQMDGHVVLTNSSVQLARLSEVGAGAASLASSKEYVFFRNLYPRGERESAFLMLSDATIRRWCGPRWRIGGSRRTQAAGVIADLQARHHDAIVAGRTRGSVDYERAVPGGGVFSWTRAGVRSDVYGDLTFLTPIAELALDQVTQAEASAYARWRARYQGEWRRFFDPIALRITVDEGSIGMDVTVMPLIEGSDYRGLIGFTRGSTIAPDAGDRHDESILHLAFALDVESPGMRNAGGFARAFSPGSGPAFGWLGGSISLFIDDDAYWEEMANAEDPGDFIGETWHRLPIALNAEVDDPLALTVFLGGLRGFIEQTAPGLTVWEPLTHKEQNYVRVSATQSMNARMPDDFTLYYAVTPESFVITPSESVLLRALDRQAERAAARESGETPPEFGDPWLGSSVALQASTRLVEILEKASVSWVRDAMRRRSWDNLPILNEWRRRYPDADPVEVHRRVWGAELICPGGGAYVWDETLGTMTSTAYGSPLAPKDGPPASLTIFSQLASGNFGLTFGDDELRARVALTRAE